MGIKVVFRVFKFCILLTSSVAAVHAFLFFTPRFVSAEGPQLAIVFPILSPELSSKYGLRKHPIRKSVRHHSGVDLAAPKNSHVRAVAEGRVIYAGWYSHYGKLVTIAHVDGFVSMYGHLSDYSVNVGDIVQPGDLVGRVGSTGLATGPHLHFEWRKDGKTFDPLKVFPSLAKDAEG